MRVTINNINKEIADLGYELCRGEGYFYFWAIDIETPELYEQSVYVKHVTSFSVDRWRNILLTAIADTEERL